MLEKRGELKMAEKFTREQELELPSFESAEEAYTYFRSLYGKDFSYQGSQEIDGVECWFCNLILNRSVYENGMKELRMGTPVMGLEFPMSYQPFELHGGHVHIIY